MRSKPGDYVAVEKRPICRKCLTTDSNPARRGWTRIECTNGECVNDTKRFACNPQGSLCERSDTRGVTMAFWSWKPYRFVELSNLSPKTQREIVTSAARRARFDWRTYRWVFPAMLAYLFALFKGTDMIFDTTSTHWDEMIIIVGLHLAAPAAFVIYLRSLRPALSAEMLERNKRPALCLRCRYDLRGCPADATVCPECGAAIASLKRSGLKG